MYWAGACLSAALTGIAAAIFCDTSLSKADRVFSVSCRQKKQPLMCQTYHRKMSQEIFKSDSGPHILVFVVG